MSVYPTSVGGAVVDSEGSILGVVAAGLSRSSIIAITRPTIRRVAEIPGYQRSRSPRDTSASAFNPSLSPMRSKQQLNLQQDSGVMALNVERTALPRAPSVTEMSCSRSANIASPGPKFCSRRSIQAP